MNFIVDVNNTKYVVDAEKLERITATGVRTEASRSTPTMLTSKMLSLVCTQYKQYLVQHSR
jgi:hypothetical protein